MTAFCVLVGKRDVRLLTDGLAVCRYPGGAMPNMSKISPFDRFPGVLTIRGGLIDLEWFHRRLSACGTLDDALRRLADAYCEHRDSGRSPLYQLVLAGWSGTAPRAVFLSGVGTSYAKAGEVKTVDRLLVVPSLSRAEMYDFETMPDLQDKFPTIMDRIVEDDMTGSVGGFCELTIVSETGTTSRIVREYGAPRPVRREYLSKMEQGLSHIQFQTLPAVFRRALARDDDVRSPHVP